jgi:hypothetical protein
MPLQACLPKMLSLEGLLKEVKGWIHELQAQEECQKIKNTSDGKQPALQIQNAYHHTTIGKRNVKKSAMHFSE